jgi:outer membrane protein assembly factor BamC
MINSKTGSFLISAAVLINLSACGYVKSYFPDKEKDYQYTTEIPPLILPDDLKQDHLPGPSASTPPSPPVGADADANIASTPVAAYAKEAAPAAPSATKAATQPVAATPSESETVIDPKLITVERVNFDVGENRLRINVPFARAWRIVGKALSRKSIEVTERNQEAGVFTVHYDPDERKVEDKSYWDELVFIFSGIQSNDKEYRLKLIANNQLTDIIVMSEDQQPLSDAASFKLLTLLQETIKADLAKK